MLLVVASAAHGQVERTVPATGRQAVVFDVERFGRYAVTADSTQGTAVRVVDRMTGAGPIHGSPGEADGRVDVFLDRGEIQVVALSDPRGTGQATVRLAPFAAPPTAPARLDEERLVRGELEDLGQASYWIDVPAGRVVAIEGAGRYLADLRLWHEGNWLVDVAPDCATYEPVAGQPWTRCRWVGAVEPGLYLVSAYGGPGQTWSEAKPGAPFQLRWGAPSLASAGRMTATLDASGYARFRAPSDATVFQVSLPDVAPVELQVSSHATNPFVSGSATSITTESRRPVTAVRASGDLPRTVTVSGPPGQAYTLTWFPSFSGLRVLDAGRWYVASLHGVDPADAVEPTALLYRRLADGRAIQSDAQTVPLDRTHRYERTFNLAERVTMLLTVTEPGPYAVTVGGTAAQVRVEPYFVGAPPDGYSSPQFTSGGVQVDLGAGTHVLDISPSTPGVATVTIAHDSWASRARSAVGWGADATPQRPAISMIADVEAGAPMELRVVSPPGGPAGLVVRALPLDPRESVPVALLPGELLELPIVAAEDGVLEARTAEGRALPVHVGDDAEGEAVGLPAGEHLATIRNDTDGVVLASLVLRPTRLDPARPLPPLDAARLAALPKFPVLSATAPSSADLDRGQTRTWAVNVAEPGLYRLQSTGLLATSGNLRTRVRTRVAREEGNGVGRNFLVASYFREGDYQLTVGTVGPSRGHLGVVLDRTGVLDGGELADGVPARITVPAGDAVRSTLVVAEAGHWRIRHEGRTGTFRCRLEDDGAWPLELPEQDCDWEGWLEPGRYVVIGLPEEVETRRLTTAVRTAAPPPREGHGPFALGLGEAATHTWIEPVDGDRVPDTWEIAVPAPVSATLTLSAEMAGELEHDGVTDRVVPGEPWTGSLGAGTVRLRLRGARRGTGVPYRLVLSPAELVAGTERDVSLPAHVPVSVGRDGVHAIWSTGGTDVRARLYSGGRVIAANDDRPDDWNFQLATRLEPGRYTLVLDPLDGGGRAHVAMRMPSEVAGPELRPGVPVPLRPGRDAVVSRLDASGSDVVVARVTGGENAGVAVEVAHDGAWTAIAHGTGRSALAVARLPEKPDGVRIRTWSEDGRGGELTVRAEAIRSRRTADNVLSGGAAVGTSWGALRAEGGAGVYQLVEDARETFTCGGPGACERGGEGLVPASDDGLVLVREGGSVRARRITLGGEPVAVRLEDDPVSVDLERGGGPAVVTVRGAAGRPGARVAKGDGAGVAPGAAVAVALSGGGRVEVWDAGGEGPIDARVSLVRVAAPDPRPASAGREALVVPARGSVSLELAGVHTGELTLDRGLVAVLGQERVAWADPGPLMVEVNGLARSIALLNPTDADALAVVDLRPSVADAPLAPGRPIEAVHEIARTRIVLVAPAADAALRLLGELDGTYVRADGRVLEGDGAPVGAGGVLHLAVRPGPGLAWVENPGQTGPRRDVDGGRPVQVGGSAAVPLTGEAVRLAVRAPGVVSVRVPCPVVADVTVTQGHSRVEVLPAGGRLDLVLPAGEADVALRALSGTALYGTATVSTGTIASLDEGLGPEVLLAPGGSAFFRFVLDRPRTIGLGVRATADRVDAQLLDEAGRPHGRGLVQLRTLEAGTWLLALSQPADAGPVRARAAVAGLVPPPHGPPAEVIRAYLEPPAASADADLWFTPAVYPGEEGYEGEYVEEEYVEEEYVEEYVEEEYVEEEYEGD